MKVNRKQVIFINGQDDITTKVSEIVNAIESLFNSYYEMPKDKRYQLLSIFYDFDLENKEMSIDDIIYAFDQTHSLTKVYMDIKMYLAIFIYEVNRNADTLEEEEISLKLKYYYNTTYKQKQRLLE